MLSVEAFLIIYNLEWMLSNLGLDLPHYYQAIAFWIYLCSITFVYPFLEQGTLVLT